MPEPNNQSKFNRENMSLAPKELLLQLITSQYGAHNAVIAEDALKTQKKQIEEGMLQGGMGFEDVMKSKGIDVNSLLNSQQQKKKGNFLYTPFQMNDKTGEVTPESILGGLIKAHPDNTLKMVQARKEALSQQGINPEEAINRLSTLNKTIDEKLPGYQAIQTADGNFIVRPKPSGVMAQLDNEQLDSISNSLLSGDLVPSQLPRLQKSQVLAMALEKDPSYNPSKADIDYAVNKVGSSNFEKLYNNVTSFERTFRKNADVALRISDSLDRSKIPLINKAIMAGKLHISGDPEASKMATALYTVATEFARLTSSPGATGSQITDSAREEARNMLNVWQNEGTIRGQLDPETGIMSIDAKNRIDALNETRDEIRNRYSNKSNIEKKQSLLTPEEEKFIQEYERKYGRTQ